MDHFDEDDPLDYIMYKDTEERPKDGRESRAGCFGVLLLVVIPTSLIWIISAPYLLLER